MSASAKHRVSPLSASVGGNVQCSAAQQRPKIGPARLAAPLTRAWQRPGTESLVASRRRLNHQCLASSAPGGSFDGSSDSEELDYSLTRELERVAQRDKYTKLASHLDLLYSVQEERSKPELCQCCRGTRELECNWCHGTGAMTIGDVLYCSSGGCTPCPVCRGTGSCQCKNCRGTGKRASWLAQGPPS